MKGITLDQWIKEVDFAVAQAQALGQKVSLGGFSMGGALTFRKAISDPQAIDGAVFLFAAALGISGVVVGNLSEALLRSSGVVDLLSRFQDRPGSLIGENPYKYARMDFEGAAALADLIKEIEGHYKDKQKYGDVQQPVFAAHAEDDNAAEFKEIETLMANHPGGAEKTYLYRISKEFRVPHPYLVLKDNVYTLDETGERDRTRPLNPKNPFFEDMMYFAQHFVEKHL